MAQIKKVEELIEETLRKNQHDIEMALMKPLAPEYPFSSNGIYFLIGKMDAGKSFWIWRHIMITERLFSKPYYSKIIFCSTSGKLDKTAEVLSKNVKTPIEYIKEENLLPYLKRHLRRKLKYYAMVKHVLSKMVETNEEMARIISKHSFMEIEDRIAYIASKLVKYQTALYPYNTLLVLVAVQTLRFVHLNVKRLATDIICYSGFSKEDFMSMLQQTPNNLDIKSTTIEYLNHKGQHDQFIMNIIADQYHYEN